MNYRQSRDTTSEQLIKRFESSKKDLVEIAQISLDDLHLRDIHFREGDAVLVLDVPKHCPDIAVFLQILRNFLGDNTILETTPEHFKIVVMSSFKPINNPSRRSLRNNPDLIINKDVDNQKGKYMQFFCNVLALIFIGAIIYSFLIFQGHRILPNEGHQIP